MKFWTTETQNMKTDSQYAVILIYNKHGNHIKVLTKAQNFLLTVHSALEPWNINNHIHALRMGQQGIQ